MTKEIALLKLLSTEHVEFFLNGGLYMKTLTYFSDLEKEDMVRSDENEGADFALQVAELSIQGPDGEYIPINGVINPLIYRKNMPTGLNVFCMYAFPSENTHQFDKRNLAFGESFVVLTDTKEFINRVRLAARSRERDLATSLVEYVDKKTYHGPLGPFRKFNNFSYQCEFHLVLKGGNENTSVLNIGDIRDISQVGVSREIYDRSPNSGRHVDSVHR